MRIFKDISIEILKLVEGSILTTEKKFTSRFVIGECIEIFKDILSFVIGELKGVFIEIPEGSKVV